MCLRVKAPRLQSDCVTSRGAEGRRGKTVETFCFSSNAQTAPLSAPPPPAASLRQPMTASPLAGRSIGARHLITAARWPLTKAWLLRAKGQLGQTPACGAQRWTTPAGFPLRGVADACAARLRCRPRNRISQERRVWKRGSGLRGDAASLCACRKCESQRSYHNEWLS